MASAIIIGVLAILLGTFMLARGWGRRMSFAMLTVGILLIFLNTLLNNPLVLGIVAFVIIILVRLTR